MDHHQPGDAKPQNDGRSHEGPPERTRRIEPPVTAKRDHDIPLKLRGIPPGEASADLGYHGDLEQATARSAQQADQSQDLSEQEYRHNHLAAIRRMFQRSGSSVLISSNIQRTPFRPSSKTGSVYQSNDGTSHKGGIFRSKIATCTGLFRRLSRV